MVVMTENCDSNAAKDCPAMQIWLALASDLCDKDREVGMNMLFEETVRVIEKSRRFYVESDAERLRYARERLLEGHTPCNKGTGKTYMTCGLLREHEPPCVKAYSSIPTSKGSNS